MAKKKMSAATKALLRTRSRVTRGWSGMAGLTPAPKAKSKKRRKRPASAADHLKAYRFKKSHGKVQNGRKRRRR